MHRARIAELAAWSSVFISLTGLAACAAAPPPPAAPRPPPDPAAYVAPLEWQANRSSVRCRETGTSLEIPRSLGFTLERLTAERATLVTSGTPPDAALMVATNRSSDALETFLDDWSELHHLIGGATPDRATLRGDLRFDGQRLLLTYVTHDGQAYALGYFAIQRNGATCRLAVLERTSSGTGHVPSLLRTIHDSPGLDLEAAPRREPPSAAMTSLVRGILDLGALILLSR